jgi:formylglycine-generating enzyme required for sulfatase activity
MVSYVSSLPARGGRRVAPLGPNEFDLGGGVRLRFVEVKPGQFTMGSPEDDPDRLAAYETPHQVTLTRAYRLGESEVTVGQFRQFVRETKYVAEGLGQSPEVNWENPGFAQTDDHPVVGVSWADAVAFCKWLRQKSGKVCRLPTEAEWEYACRAGKGSPYHFGQDLSPREAHYNSGDTGRGSTAPVKQYRPNAWGLYDMHGNAAEWCADWYGDYPVRPVTDPPGPHANTAGFRVIRGGSWQSFADECRSAYRGRRIGTKPSDTVGFRVCAEP